MGLSRENVENENFTSVSLDQFIECDHQFHMALVDYVDNLEYKQTLQRLMYLIQLTTKGALVVPGRAEDTLMEHRLFYSCLTKGDGDEAYRRMRRIDIEG